MSERLIIFDTTLRDGEQSPGISLDVAEKLEIAEQLARLGVDYIEAGFPVASQGDFEAVEAIAKTVQGPVIAGLSRTHVADVDRCWDAVRHADRSRIHVFISTSPNHMEHMLKMTPAQVVAETRRRSEGQGAHRRRRVQPPGRHPHAARLHDGGAAGGRRRRRHHPQHSRHGGLRHPVGLRRPHPVRAPQHHGRLHHVHPLPQRPRPGHRQLAGRRAGGGAPGGGVRERPGGAGRQRRPRGGRDGRAHPGRPVPRHRGRRAHRGTGPHQPAGEPPHRLPRAVQQGGGGPQRVRARVGHPPARRAGRLQHLRDHRGVVGGRPGQPDRPGQALRPPRLQGHAGEDGPARAGRRPQRRLRPLQGTGRPQGSDHRGRSRGHRGRGDRWRWCRARLRAGVTRGHRRHGGRSRARVVLMRNGEKTEASADGDGMIDAACQAIKAATGIDARLTDFNVSSVTGGVDALGDVVVQLEAAGVKVSGRGVSTDVVEASARAFLNATNKVVRVRARAEERGPIDEVTP